LGILLAHWDPKSLKEEEEREVTLSSTKLMQLLRLFGSFTSALFAQLSLTRDVAKPSSKGSSTIEFPDMSRDFSRARLWRNTQNKIKQTS
jgi:hypothetical protein